MRAKPPHPRRVFMQQRSDAGAPCEGTETIRAEIHDSGRAASYAAHVRVARRLDPEHERYTPPHEHHPSHQSRARPDRNRLNVALAVVVS